MSDLSAYHLAKQQMTDLRRTAGQTHLTPPPGRARPLAALLRRLGKLRHIRPKHPLSRSGLRGLIAAALLLAVAGAGGALVASCGSSHADRGAKRADHAGAITGKDRFIGYRTVKGNTALLGRVAVGETETITLPIDLTTGYEPGSITSASNTYRGLHSKWTCLGSTESGLCRFLIRFLDRAGVLEMLSGETSRRVSPFGRVGGGPSLSDLMRATRQPQSATTPPTDRRGLVST